MVRKPISFWFTILVVYIGFIFHCSHAYALSLQSGVPVDLSIPALTYFSDIYIDVPAGATKLTVTIANGSGNLDLYLKYGSPLSGKTVGELKANADIRSDGPTADETIVITLSTSPALREGRWYVIPLNMNNTKTSSILTATLEIKKEEKGSGGAAWLEFSANNNFIVPWGYLRLSYRIKSFKPGTRADLYLALHFHQSGVLLFMTSNYQFLTNAVPFATNIDLADRESLILETDFGGDLSPDTVTLYGVLVKTGSSPFDPSNWLSNLAEMTFVFSYLSGEQWQTLATRGNPHFISIRFIRETRLRVGRWYYSNQVFEFINGSLQERPEEMIPASACGKGEPVQYDEIMFRPTTTPEDMRKLFGDPDHVLDGSTTPDTKIWIFDGAGISMTIRDGMIDTIEVY